MIIIIIDSDCILSDSDMQIRPDIWSSGIDHVLPTNEGVPSQYIIEPCIK